MELNEFLEGKKRELEGYTVEIYNIDHKLYARVELASDIDYSHYRSPVRVFNYNKYDFNKVVEVILDED